MQPVLSSEIHQVYIMIDSAVQFKLLSGVEFIGHWLMIMHHIRFGQAMFFAPGKGKLGFEEAG